MRRVRRLFPALWVTVAVSGVGSALLLSPEQMLRFAVSAGAALLSVSNVLFWIEADYFDALASTKPLLHTWSLAVEEQFYLVWPALLLVLLLRLAGAGDRGGAGAALRRERRARGILDPAGPGGGLLPAADADRRARHRRAPGLGRRGSGPPAARGSRRCWRWGSG